MDTGTPMLMLFFLYLSRSAGLLDEPPRAKQGGAARPSMLSIALLPCLLAFFRPSLTLNPHTTRHAPSPTAQATMGGGIITKSLGLLYLLSSAEYFAAARRMDATAAGAAINNVQQGHHHHVSRHTTE